MPLVLGCNRWPVSRLSFSRRYHLRFATTSCAASVRQRCRRQGCSAIAAVVSPHALAELSILDVSGNVSQPDVLAAVRKVRIPKRRPTGVIDHSIPVSPTSDSSRHHQSEASPSGVSTLATGGSSRQRTAPRKRQAASTPESPDGTSSDSKRNLPAAASAAGAASSSTHTQRKSKSALRADSKNAASQGAPQSSAAGEKSRGAPEKKAAAAQQRGHSAPMRRSQRAPTPAAAASSTASTSTSSTTTGSPGPQAPSAATSASSTPTSAPANAKATMLDAIMKRKNLRKMRTLMSAPGAAKPKPLVHAVALQALEPSQQQLSAIEAAKAKVAKLLEQRAEATTAAAAQGQQERVQHRKPPREAEEEDEVQERSRAERLPRIHSSMTMEQREQAYQQLLHHVLTRPQLEAELRYNGVLPLVVQRTMEQDRGRADAAGHATPARVHSGKQPAAADAAHSLQQVQAEAEDVDMERLQEMAHLVNIAVGMKLPDRAFVGVRAVLLSHLEPRAVADRVERWAKVCGSTYTQQYLSKEPTLLGYEPAVLLDSLEVLNRGLGLAPGECVKLAVKHPVLIGISADYLDQRLKELQELFHTGRSDTVNLVLGNPSVLVSPLALLRTKVRDLALLLVEPPQVVVELLLRSPLLSSRSSRWLAQSIQGLAQSLQRPAYLAARMVANKPSLLAVGDASLQWRWAELQRLAEDSDVQAATLARMTPGELARALCAPNTRFARFERMRELGLMGLRLSKPNFILAMGNPMFENSLLKWQQRLAEGAAAGQDGGEEEEHGEMEGEVEGRQEGGADVGRLVSSAARRAGEGKASLVMA